MTLEEMLLILELQQPDDMQGFYLFGLFLVLWGGFLFIVYGSKKYKAINNFLNFIFLGERSDDGR